MKQTIITALDIGTTKICAIIAVFNEDNKLEIKGIGTTDSNGLEKGIVKDINATAESIKKALKQAEEASELPAENIYAGIAGEHIKSKNAIGRISVTGANGNEPGEITQTHIDQVINDAKNSIKIMPGNENLEIIHGIPQFFDIDNQDGITNPLNMNGFQLTAHVHIVLADVAAMRNILKCIEVAGYHTANIILEPLASSKAVLNEDEKKLGVLLIDIGGGTSDIVLYYKGSIRFSQVKPIGGDSITSDLAIGLRTTHKYAENIKIQLGNALPESIEEDEEFTVDGIGGRPPTNNKIKTVANIIEPRMREILELCYKTAISNFSNLEILTAGVVLTGGASLLRNVTFLTSEIFNMPVKVGYPDVSKLNGATSRLENPKYATSVGLLYYALEMIDTGASTPKSRKTKSGSGVNTKNLIEKIKKFFNFSDFI